MFSKLLLAFPAFVVAAAGVGAAELYLASDNGLVIAGCLVVGLFILGYAADYTAREILLPDHPVAAVWTMELWALCPGILAICAAAGLLVLNVRVGEIFPKGQTEPEGYKTLVTALTALVTAGFLKAADDADAGWIAPHVMKAFRNKYRDVATRAAHPAEGVYWFALGAGHVEPWAYQAIYQDVDGWSFTARHKRARGIAAVLPNEPSR